MNTYNMMSENDYDEVESCCESCEMPRQFITKEEKIDLLRKYKQELDMESLGVSEAIIKLEKEV
jgi:hypothetical protein